MSSRQKAASIAVIEGEDLASADRPFVMSDQLRSVIDLDVLAARRTGRRRPA
jgi:hypothetical protein